MEARLLRIMSAAAILAALILLAAPAAAQGAGESDAPAYMNHTVGGKDGWFFDAKTNTSSATTRTGPTARPSTSATTSVCCLCYFELVVLLH
jgi:hypothetical protein